MNFFYYFTIITNYIVSTFRLKLDWCNGEEAASLTSLLQEKIADTEPTTPPPVVSPPRKKTKMFSFMSDTKVATSPSGSPGDELTQY